MPLSGTELLPLAEAGLLALGQDCCHIKDVLEIPLIEKTTIHLRCEVKHGKRSVTFEEHAFDELDEAVRLERMKQFILEARPR